MVVRRAKQKQISFGYCDTETGQRVYPAPPPDEMADLLPEQQPPSQLASTHSDSMEFSISCWPPLGQPTSVESDQHSVKITVLLESADQSTVDDGTPPQVCIWHNHNGNNEWAELPLEPESDVKDIVVVRGTDSQKASRWWYTARLSGLPKHGHVVSFTLKYLANTSQGWQWVKDTAGLQDGELYYLGSADFGKHSSYDIGHFFSELSSDITVKPQRPETNASHLWELTCPVKPAQGIDSGYQHHQLGKPTHCAKWFALVRLWSPWLAPRHGRGGKFELDKDGILLSFLRTDGLHVVALAISGMEDIVSTFIHDDLSNVIIRGRNDRANFGTSRVLVAVAETFEVANAAVFYHARKVVARLASVTATSQKAAELPEVKPEWMEEWYDGLAYCTWNGLGQNLTASAISRALDELSKNDINITNLIIDDNWQSLAEGDTQFKRGWSRFEANSVGFPDGLKATTAAIRKEHPNVNHIAVWHAILGYWGGIDPNGEIAKKYKTIEVEKEPGVAEGKFTVVAAEDAAQMYDDFYSFLRESGIDSVKTDAQFFLDMLLHAPDRRAMITEYQDAWSLAHLRHFYSRAISCMSQIPQALFHSQLPRNKPRLLVRNSDDFFPDVETSHAWHVYCNAHNSLLMQHLNALPDWDMFQTSHGWASFHAAARCVSGGPIYFTDVPGEHNIKLIRQMTGQTTRGTTVILRPHNVGKAIGVYNDYNAQVLLKIGTYVGKAETGSGILGVFNISQRTSTEMIPLRSFPGTESGSYVIGSFGTGRVSQSLSRGGGTTCVNVRLQPRAWDILTAYALRSFTLRDRQIHVAIMGLLGKMTGAAAVESSGMNIEPNGRLRIELSLKALGILGLWISDLASRDLEDTFMIMIFGKPIPFSCLSRSETNEEVLEIDVECAWKENGERAGWSNEVGLEVFLS